MCVLFSYLYTVQPVKAHSDVIILINNNSKTMFMVLFSWQCHCESSPGLFDECTLCFKKKFTLLLFAITKSDVDRFQYYLVGM